MTIAVRVDPLQVETLDGVAASCSRSPGPPFYDWSKHVASARQLADDELAERIEGIHTASRRTYGWPRVHRALRHEDVLVFRKRVARMMRQQGLIGRCRRWWVKTTISDPEVVAVDRLKRAFGPTTELDRVYVGDITYIRTSEA